MNNKFETVMSWIMYVRAGIWKIEQLNEQADNPEYIKEKYELLFKNELCREYNDATEHMMPGLYKRIGSFLCCSNTIKKDDICCDFDGKRVKRVYNAII